MNPLAVKDISTQYGSGKVGKLSDGTTVVARPGSETGGATLEIRVSNNKVFKIRYWRIRNMERWEEVFKGKIPKGIYQIQLVSGEKQGLVIELLYNNIHVMIKFGMVQAVRMLEEGIVQSNLYSESEIKRYKDNNFSNVLYEVRQGEFAKQIKKMLSGYGEVLNLKHYVVITQNYNVDIITEWEPIIKILAV